MRPVRVFSIEDVPIPPLHPNCRCELLVMDAWTQALYSMNSRGFLESFYRARNGPEGGIYLVDHSVSPTGVARGNLTRISMPNGHVIIDLSRPLGWESPDYYASFAGAKGNGTALAPLRTG